MLENTPLVSEKFYEELAKYTSIVDDAGNNIITIAESDQDGNSDIICLKS